MLLFMFRIIYEIYRLWLLEQVFVENDIWDIDLLKVSSDSRSAKRIVKMLYGTQFVPQNIEIYKCSTVLLHFQVNLSIEIKY